MIRVFLERRVLFTKTTISCFFAEGRKFGNWRRWSIRHRDGHAHAEGVSIPSAGTGKRMNGASTDQGSRKALTRGATAKMKREISGKHGKTEIHSMIGRRERAGSVSIVDIALRPIENFAPKRRNRRTNGLRVRGCPWPPHYFVRECATRYQPP